MLMQFAFNTYMIFTVCLPQSQCLAAEKSAYPS